MDYISIMDEKRIDFDIKVDSIRIDFMDAMHITTIFSNLLDYAAEACDDIEKDRKI